MPGFELNKSYNNSPTGTFSEKSSFGLDLLIIKS
jgi:hypothetical protein